MISPLSAWFYSSVKVNNSGKCNRHSLMFEVSKAMLSIITAQASSVTLTTYLPRTLLLKMCFADLMLWLQDVEKSASNWPGNGLPVGYLSWYQNMLWHLLEEKDISGLTQSWILQLVILTRQAICAVGATAAWQVMGNEPLSDWIWGVLYHREFHA